MGDRRLHANRHRFRMVRRCRIRDSINERYFGGKNRTPNSMPEPPGVYMTAVVGAKAGRRTRSTQKGYGASLWPRMRACTPGFHRRRSGLRGHGTRKRPALVRVRPWHTNGIESFWSPVEARRTREPSISSPKHLGIRLRVCWQAQHPRLRNACPDAPSWPSPGSSVVTLYRDLVAGNGLSNAGPGVGLHATQGAGQLLRRRAREVHFRDQARGGKS